MATKLALAELLKKPLTETQIVDHLILANKMLKSRISESLKRELTQFINVLETTLRFQQ